MSFSERDEGSVPDRERGELETKSLCRERHGITESTSNRTGSRYLESGEVFWVGMVTEWSHNHIATWVNQSVYVIYNNKQANISVLTLHCPASSLPHLHTVQDAIITTVRTFLVTII